MMVTLGGELGPARDGEGGLDLVGMGGSGAVTGRESARSRSVAKTSSTGRRVQIGELSSMWKSEGEGLEGSEVRETGVAVGCDMDGIDVSL